MDYSHNIQIDFTRVKRPSQTSSKTTASFRKGNGEGGVHCNTTRGGVSEAGKRVFMKKSIFLNL